MPSLLLLDCWQLVDRLCPLPSNDELIAAAGIPDHRPSRPGDLLAADVDIQLYWPRVRSAYDR